MISLTKIRELDLTPDATEGRPSHLSAASGLVRVGAWLYVVADDQLHLGVFRADSDRPGELFRLFDGTLPAEAKSRKKMKPDFEAIVHLPGHIDNSRGALLVLGSGSRPNRQRGAILPLDQGGAIDGAAHAIDLSPVLAPLGRRFPALNIEGAVMVGEEFRLLHRGNKADARNAVIRYPRQTFLATIAGSVEQIEPVAIDLFDLGRIDGIPFSFTDGASLPDGRVVFTAVAEDTDNAYDDGRCAGAAVGIIRGTELQRVDRLDRACKVEGVHAIVTGKAIELLMVTDADDPERPAELLTAKLTE